MLNAEADHEEAEDDDAATSSIAAAKDSSDVWKRNQQGYVRNRGIFVRVRLQLHRSVLRN
jgi:hypothetical protein